MYRIFRILIDLSRTVKKVLSQSGNDLAFEFYVFVFQLLNKDVRDVQLVEVIVNNSCISNQLSNNRGDSYLKTCKLHIYQHFKQQIHKRTINQTICDLLMLDNDLKIIQCIHLLIYIRSLGGKIVINICKMTLNLIGFNPLDYTCRGFCLKGKIIWVILHFGIFFY